MYRRSLSQPEGSGQRKFSLPKIRYSKSSHESISISWDDAFPFAAKHLPDEQRLTEETDDTSAAGACKIEKAKASKSGASDENYQQCFNEAEMIMAIDINDDQGATSPTGNGVRIFDLTSDMSDMKRKGMTKGHYVDKALKKTCHGCQKQFKLKRKQQHCRRCGEVFCIKCVKYRRKLNLVAHPDPEGKLRKVCKACFEGDSLVLGTVRSLTNEFSSQRTFARYASMINSRVNSLTTTFWPDQIDRRAECTRLLTGFQQEVRQLGSLDVLRMKLKTPAWQKSKYWDVEIQATKCRACKGDVGLRKSIGNCRVCGLALCKKCSYKELLLFYDNGHTTSGEAKLAIINISGGPSLEPNVSILLYICIDCKRYMSEKQSLDLFWYKGGLEKSVMDDMNDIEPKFFDLKRKTDTLITKIEEMVDEARDSGLPILKRRAALNEIATLRATLDKYEKEFKTVRSWLKGKLTRTETTLLKNYIKCKYEMFMEYRYKCRALGNKLDATENRK